MTIENGNRSGVRYLSVIVSVCTMYSLRHSVVYHTFSFARGGSPCNSVNQVNLFRVISVSFVHECDSVNVRKVSITPTPNVMCMYYVLTSPRQQTKI